MYRFKIKGVVQGVGFRPYIFNACIKSGLCGSVQNTGDGVIVDVNNKESFEKILKNVPPNASVNSYSIEKIGGNSTTFIIKKSMGEGYSEIPPDFYLCNDCQKEIRNKKNRRYNYFFTTCTNCGPRFSTTRRAPYDRHTTSMDTFSMCRTCRKEYEAPEDRRYHAQTIACHNCGPRIALYKNNKKIPLRKGDNYIEKTALLLKQGELVAIKGIGGFHISGNTQNKTVEKLKKITRRKDKPYAVLCKDINMADRVARLTATQKEILISKERSITLVAKKEGWGDAISELDTVGIMLPYSALHHLLFAYIDEPIIFTSANIYNEPITTRKEEQITSYVLDHNREIVNATDDSVIKVINNVPLFIRRSRGFVPQSLRERKGGKNILALGAEINNTFCIYHKEGRTTPSQYMGTTSNLKTFDRYKTSVNAFLSYTNIEPELIVADKHPYYNTTRFAETLSEELQIPLKHIQHHKAHVFGVAREHELADFVGIAADGLGFGDDGTIWGGEIFDGNNRIGHLEQHQQLGGDSAAQFPAKMLFSILRNFLPLEETKPFMKGFFKDKELLLLNTQLKEKYNTPLTSSCGRILDAISFLLGFCDERTYDGRPAMLLEANSKKPYALEPVIKDGVLMTTPLFEYVVKNLDKDKSRLAGTAQLYLAKGLHDMAKVCGKPIVWSGGCAYNTIMTAHMLENNVLVHKNIPPGDGGISFGQIAYALANSWDNLT